MVLDITCSINCWLFHGKIRKNGQKNLGKKRKNEWKIDSVLTVLDRYYCLEAGELSKADSTGLDEGIVLNI